MHIEVVPIKHIDGIEMSIKLSQCRCTHISLYAEHRSGLNKLAKLRIAKAIVVISRSLNHASTQRDVARIANLLVFNS